MLAAHHFRYGKTGGIAYRHVSDNYIALFSRFIGCGIYEATYILDILHHSLKDLRPTQLHADMHGQSTHLFALAYLLGIELLPRIRSWQKLKLYHPGDPIASSPSNTCFQHRSIGAGSRNTTRISFASHWLFTVVSWHLRRS